MLWSLTKWLMEPAMCILLHESEMNQDVATTSLDLVVEIDCAKRTFPAPQIAMNLVC